MFRSFWSSGRLPASLRVLCLEGRNMPRLPPQLSAISSLRALWLRSNAFSSADSLDDLPTSLSRLDLDVCRLTRLPTRLSALTALACLSLTPNPLTLTTADVRSLLAPLTRLSHLDVGCEAYQQVEASEWAALLASCPFLSKITH